MAQPKLALIPATQGSKLFSVLPTDGVGDFDFSRNSAATRINKDGLIETVASGVSRLNYPLIDGVVNGCPSHLLEPQRKNIIPYSEDFFDASWVKSNATITSNSAISPKGDLTADTITDNTVNDLHVVVIFNQWTSANLKTASVFAKKNTADYLYITNSSTGQVSFFNLADGTLGYVDGLMLNANIEDYGNGWYRCSVSNQQNGTLGIGLSLQDNIESYSGSGESIYIWGAQLEEGSFGTSYIPNYGTSAGITRSAETATGAGDASTFNDSEGVLMAEISALADDGTDRRISLSDGSGNNRIVLGFRSTSQQTIGWMIVNGVNTPLFYISSDVTTNSKYAIKYKQNDLQFWVDGFKVDYSLSVDMYPNGTLNQLKLEDAVGGVSLYGNVKQLQYFDSALNNSDLETLTSWTSFTDLANGQQYSIK